MKRSRFTEEQIIGVLREQEAGASVADVLLAVVDGLKGFPEATLARHARRGWATNAGRRPI